MSQPEGESPRPWQTVGSDVIIADRWIRLRADECIDGDGRTIAPFYVLEYGDWISVLALDVRGDANSGNHTNRVHHFLARDCVRVSEQALDETESITVRVMPLRDVADRLEQSYHLLTWYKAMAWLAR